MSPSKIQVAPSLLACDWGRLKEEIVKVEEAGADLLHVDVMDGQFVPNISIGFPIIEAIRKITRLPIDTHLMIADADRYLETFSTAGCDWLSVHVEACPHLNRTLARIRELGMKAGIAINPGTSLSALDASLFDADFVLLMSVNPGYGGQRFIPASIERLKTLKKMIGTKPVQIEIDGGIKLDNAKEVTTAGADILVVGTGLFSEPDFKSTIARLKS